MTTTVESNRAPSRTDEDTEFAAITEAEIWEEARDRLQIAIDADTDNRNRAKTAILFREGVGQWDIDNAPDNNDSPDLVINLTDAMVERVENNIRQQRPRGKVHPVGDGADIEIAEVINGIGRHIETRSEASVAYDTAASAALNGGWGEFRLIAEYVSPRSFQKDLRIVPIRNQFTVYRDPGAILPHGGDAMWCLISVKMNRQEYRRRYPTAPNAAWSDLGIGDGVRDWDNKEEIRLAEYFRIRERPERLYLIKGPRGEFTKYLSEMPRGEGNKLMSIDEARGFLAERGFVIAGDRDSVKRQVEWFRLNGTKVLERQQIPGSYIPVFRVEGKVVDADGKVRRRGMVEPMMDPQRMVNYGEVAKIKRLGLAPKAPWVAADGSFDGRPEWDDANLKTYSKLEYVPVVVETSSGSQIMPPPMRQPPAQIEQGFAEFVQGMRSNLMGIAGMPNEPGQDQQGQVVSGRAIRRRQYLSDQAHFRWYDNLTLAIAQCWRVMVEWIPVYYSEERMQRIIGEDSTPEMVKLNEKTHEQDDQGNAVAKVKNDLSVGLYDVVMDTGPGYETKREEGAENLIELLKVQALAEIIAKTGPDLVFRSIDHPYMQELADRLQAQTPDGLEKIIAGLSSRARSIVTALQKQVDALKQENQTLQQEVKSGVAKAHIAAVAKVHATEETNATKRADTESRERTQIKTTAMKIAGEHQNTAMEIHGDMAREEIHTAGTMLNTHVEAAHRRADAERMIEAGENAEKGTV